MDNFHQAVLDILVDAIYYTDKDIKDALQDIGINPSNYDIKTLEHGLKRYHNLMQCDDCGEWKFKPELVKKIENNTAIFYCGKCVK